MDVGNSEKNTDPNHSKINTDDLDTSHYLLFKLGTERFGCPLLQVQEVVRVPQIKALPQKVRNLIGIVNLKGRVLSVMDLRARLGIDAQNSADALMFIVRAQGIHLGLIVDSAEAVVEIPPNDIQNPLLINPKIPTQFLLGIGKLGDSLVHLLDLESLVAELAPRESQGESEGKLEQSHEPGHEGE